MSRPGHGRLYVHNRGLTYRLTLELQSLKAFDMHTNIFKYQGGTKGVVADLSLEEP